MKELCSQLFEKLNQKLSSCADCQPVLHRWIECCFVASELAWQDLKTQLQHYSFANCQEEIWFFKTMKPQFTALIELFTLLYRVELFVPDEKEVATRYWERELKRIQDFLDHHASFFDYYKSAGTNQDDRYFLRAAYKPEEQQVAKLYDLSSDLLTSHDHLVASILAREKFRQYVLHRLDETKNYKDEVSAKN